MNAPFYSDSKASFTHSAFLHQLLALWAAMKPALLPEPTAAAEPACSPRYAMLRRQELRATRLFWLTSGAIGVMTLVLAVLESL